MDCVEKVGVQDLNDFTGPANETKETAAAPKLEI
jgi:hypothetical protein